MAIASLKLAAYDDDDDDDDDDPLPSLASTCSNKSFSGPRPGVTAVCSCLRVKPAQGPRYRGGACPPKFLRNFRNCIKILSFL